MKKIPIEELESLQKYSLFYLKCPNVALTDKYYILTSLLEINNMYTIDVFDISGQKYKTIFMLKEPDTKVTFYILD